MRTLFLLGAVGASTISMAITSVVPNAFANTEGPGIFSLTATATAGRTFMLVMDESQLTSLAGTNLTGMQFRVNGGATWPPTAASMASFDVWLGASVDPSAMSNTFAANFTSGSTQVRNGGVTWNPGDFPGGGTPNNFGPSINFNMGSYAYTGGDLAILFRFSGQTGATTQSPLDAIAATDTANGWGTLFSARWTSSSTGVTGGNANFLVTQLTGEPIPEPATMTALAIGAAALIRRRRQK